MNRPYNGNPTTHHPGRRPTGYPLVGQTSPLGERSRIPGVVWIAERLERVPAN